MPYKIKSLSVQGIRGFNKQQVIPINAGVTLLYGENGSGKSSLLQSIEWALTGDIYGMKGGDFVREDAIVNIFNKNKRALVEIILENQSSTMILRRNRKMGTRTTSGKQPLELKHENNSFDEDNSQEELEKTLGMNLETFPQTKYLHQETIREILHAKPEERSQAIDKLLGTFEVREFAKSLDVDRQIKSSSANVQSTIESLKRDKIQFLINLKRSLDQTKTGLLINGYTDEQLTILATINKLEKYRSDINLLDEAYERPLKTAIELAPNSQSLTESHKTMVNHLNELDRTRLEAINRINHQKISLKTDSKRYDELFNQIQGMKQLDATAIKTRIEEINQQVKSLDIMITAVSQKLASLPHRRSIYDSAENKLKNEKDKLSALRQEFGTIEDIQKRIENGEEETKRIQRSLDDLSGQQQLITLAINHIESTKIQECPISARSIDNAQLIIDLKKKISDEMANSIKNLKESEKKIRFEKSLFDKAIEESDLLLKSMHSSETAFNQATEDIKKLVPNFEQTDLDVVIKGWENEINEISGKASELKNEQRSLGDTLTRLSQIQLEMNSLQKTLQKEAAIAIEGPELVQRVEEVIIALDSEIAKYSDPTIIDSLRKSLSELTEILNYLRDDERVNAAEKELPLIEKQVKDLEARLSRMQGLAASLQSIRQITADYEKNASIAQLEQLEDNINLYYGKIEGHPYFSRLKIDVEKEEPLIFSIRAASSNEDTYIPTRFSTAQLNAVALSIFMSYSAQQAGDFPLMIFDDPTQNMDKTHKESFVKLVAELLPNYQVIIATEDNDTRIFLEKYCTGIKTYEMGNWTSEGSEIKLA